MDMGIEADLIVMHPYDRWGFSHMSKEEDDLYWNYVVARFSAYRNVWWSHVGRLNGLSHERIKFFHGILSETSGHGLKLANGIFDETVAVPDSPFAPDYEIHYYGFGRPSFRDYVKDPTKQYKVEIIDTWDMTVTDVGVCSGKFRVKLSGKEYIAVRIRVLV